MSHPKQRSRFEVSWGSGAVWHPTWPSGHPPGCRFCQQEWAWPKMNACFWMITHNFYGYAWYGPKTWVSSSWSAIKSAMAIGMVVQAWNGYMLFTRKGVVQLWFMLDIAMVYSWVLWTLWTNKRNCTILYEMDWWSYLKMAPWWSVPPVLIPCSWHFPLKKPSILGILMTSWKPPYIPMINHH